MPRLNWSPRAIQDVERLHAFVSEKNPVAAKRFVSAIRSGVASLSRHPQSGRHADSMEPGFRERVIPFAGGAYVVLYRIEGEEVVLVAVRHGREAGY